MDRITIMLMLGGEMKDSLHLAEKVINFLCKTF